MQQQTLNHVSSEIISSSHIRCSSLLYGDPKQVGTIFLKSTLKRKLQQLFSISFRKILNHNSQSQVSKLNERHKDCKKSHQLQHKKSTNKQKIQTQKHSMSSSYTTRHLEVFSQQTKTVLNEIAQCDKLVQFNNSSKRIQRIILLEIQRLQKVKNNNKYHHISCISDAKLTLNCIYKLVEYIRQSSNRIEQLSPLKMQIEQLEHKDYYSNKHQQKSGKVNSLFTAEMSQQIQNLIAIFKQNKITDIKKNIQQQSKKLNDNQKQLFEVILSTVTKLEFAQQSSLSQITQLSSRLLEEQPSIQKNIIHIQKQKRIFQKMLEQAKEQHQKSAYYNLIDTSLYLLKLFNNLKNKDCAAKRQQVCSLKSPQKARKPSKIKTLQKSKQSFVIASLSKLQTNFQIQSVFESAQSEEVCEIQLTSFLNKLLQVKSEFKNGGFSPQNKQQIIQKWTNNQLKNIMEIFIDILEECKNQSHDLNNLVEILSFDIQNFKARQENLQQILQNQRQKQDKYKTMARNILQLLGIGTQSQVLWDCEQMIQKVQNQLHLSRNIKNQLPEELKENNIQNIVKLCVDYSSVIGQKSIDSNRILLQIQSICPELSLILQECQKKIQKNDLVSYQYNETLRELNDYKESLNFQLETKQNQIFQLQKNNSQLQNQIFELKISIKEDSYFCSPQNVSQSSSKQAAHKINMLQQQLQQSRKQHLEIIDAMKFSHLHQKQNWQMQNAILINKQNQLHFEKTNLEGHILELKKQIQILKEQLKKKEQQIDQQQVISSLRQENAILRQSVIQSRKINSLIDNQKDSSAGKNGEKSLENRKYQTKKSFSKNKALNIETQQYQHFHRQITEAVEQKTILEAELKRMKEKLGIMTLQNKRDQGIIINLRKQIKVFQIQYKSCRQQNQILKSQIDTIKRKQTYSKQKPKYHRTMENSPKFNNKFSQQFNNNFEGETRIFSSYFPENNALQQQKLQQRRIREQAKFQYINATQQSFRILINQNKSLQNQINYINDSLASERIMYAIPPKIIQNLEQSIKTMQNKLLKLKYGQFDIYDELRDECNLQTLTSYQTNTKLKKSSYEFVTSKYSSKIKKNELNLSPKANRIDAQIKKLERQKSTLESKVKLLSIFTIIDGQNKAFVHNINKIICSLLEFLFTSEYFQECQYNDFDIFNTLSEYLLHEDYEGYFQGLQTFFKQLFLNTFQTKNAIITKQTNQLLFLKEKMEDLLSQKIDQIEQQEHRLSYTQRTPLKNYNGDGRRESIYFSNCMHKTQKITEFQDAYVNNYKESYRV